MVAQRHVATGKGKEKMVAQRPVELTLTPFRRLWVPQYRYPGQLAPWPP